MFFLVFIFCFGWLSAVFRPFWKYLGIYLMYYYFHNYTVPKLQYAVASEIAFVSFLLLLVAMALRSDYQKFFNRG